MALEYTFVFPNSAHIQAVEFVQFKERLEHSHQYLMSKFESSILRIKQKADNIDEVQSVVEISNSGVELLKLREEICKSLTFNADTLSRPWWTLTPDAKHLLIGKFNTDAVCGIRETKWQHIPDKSEKELDWHKVIERSSLLPRLIYPSVQCASLLNENGKAADSSTDSNQLESQAKSLGLSFNDAPSMIVKISSGQRAVKWQHEPDKYKKELDWCKVIERSSLLSCLIYPPIQCASLLRENEKATDDSPTDFNMQKSQAKSLVMIPENSSGQRAIKVLHGEGLLKKQVAACSLPQPPFLLFVRTLSGKSISLMVGSCTTVSYLKKMIYHKEGIRSNLQRLIFAGKQLEDEHTLGYYHIQKESTLSVCLRLPGGRPRRGHYECCTCNLFFANLKLKSAHKHDANTVAEVPEPEEPLQEEQPPQHQLLYTNAKKMIKRSRKQQNQQQQ